MYPVRCGVSNHPCETNWHRGRFWNSDLVYHRCCTNGSLALRFSAIFSEQPQDWLRGTYGGCAPISHKHCKDASRPHAEPFLAILCGPPPPDFLVDRFASCVHDPHRLYRNVKIGSVLVDLVYWRLQDLLLDTFSHCGPIRHKKNTLDPLSPRSHFPYSIYDAMVLLKFIDY